MASLKEVKELLALCEKFDLEGREILSRHTNTELASMYNGIGPDSFPQWLRAVLDALHPSLAPVAFIHDVEWSGSDGTKESFTASNERFKRNGYAVAKALFGWWRPRRYLVMNDARRFGNICQSFGWDAWIAPFKARSAASASAAQDCATAAQGCAGGAENGATGAGDAQ